MMIDDILEQLDDQLDNYLELWTHHLQQSSYYESIFVGHSDSRQAFHTLLATLKPFDSTGSTPAQQQPSQTEFFVTLAQHQRASGMTTQMCIICFKSMRLAIEDLIEAVIIADHIKLKALRLFHRQTDIIETAIIGEKDHNDSDKKTLDLQRVNRELTGKKNTYESIFSATSNLVLLTDKTGIIIEANPEAVVFFSGQQLIGQFCGKILDLPSDSLAELLQQITPNQVHEITLQRDQFSQVFNLQALPLSRSPVAEHGIMLLLNDITCTVDHRQAMERRVTERTRALANSEKMLDAIFQSVGKGILLIDSDREIVKANQQASEIFGIPPEVLIGTPFRYLTDEAGCNKLSAIRENLIEGQRRHVEVTSVYVDGKTFPCEITMTRMDLDNQKFWPVIVRDISEQLALESGLREEKLNTEEMNVTLRNVLKSIESDRQQFEQNLTHRIRSGLLPGLEKVRHEKDERINTIYLDLLKEQLIALTTDFETELDADLLKLSKSELKVCRFIKAGLSGKEICETMNLSFETIQTHRKNIRKKLCLRGKDVNLHTFLINRNCDLGTTDGN
ncbi:MAG: PAS domain S-box protein [Deltaproteobacteria bacterium]|nr:PAS domain S-box protein [Deltaproteobacteria bacterium]